MATTLALTVKPSVGAVLVEITGAPAGAVVITRTDINGTAQVRLQANQQPIGGSLTIFDYEVALNGTASYSVQDSASLVTTGTADLAISTPFVNAPVLPHLRQAVEYVTDYDSQEENGGTVHWIIGRVDPLVTGSPLRMRQGSLTLFASTYADARALKAVAAPGEVLLFRQADFEGMDMYLVPNSVRISPSDRTASGRKWAVAIEYQEVIAPDSPVRSSTWNFDEVKALGTFTYVKSQFLTFNNLVAGP